MQGMLLEAEEQVSKSPLKCLKGSRKVGPLTHFSIEKDEDDKDVRRENKE